MGYTHCVCLGEDGSVWSSGSNHHGQLGLDKYDRNYRFRVRNLPPIVSVQSGHCSSLCLDVSGSIWSFGNNHFGQLGLGDTQSRSSPQKISGLPPVRSFSFHNIHVVCICEDGTLWGFGSNGYGELGLGHKDQQSTPIQLLYSYIPDEIISISCGNHHTLFLTSVGQVYSAGYNNYGQLGIGRPGNWSTPILIPNMNDCIQIVCGGYVSCLVDSSNHLWVCGSHCGIQSKLPQNIATSMISVGLVESIHVGRSQTLCVNQSGELWGWGDPSHGELGNGSTEQCKEPILIRENIETAMCIGHCSFIRNESNEIFFCGKNENGQLGIGNNKDQITFLKFSEEEFSPRFGIRKCTQKSARSAIPRN